jgi:hypothetical protein
MPEIEGGGKMSTLKGKMDPFCQLKEGTPMLPSLIADLKNTELAAGEMA